MNKHYRSKIAEENNIFVVTEKGFQKTPDEVKKEREIGKPVKGFESKVPVSWIEKGYVVEVRNPEDERTQNENKSEDVQQNHRRITKRASRR